MTGLHGNAVAFLEVLDGGADGVDNAGGFVAEDHGLFDDEVRDAAVLPVVDLRREVLDLANLRGKEGVAHIRSADTSPLDVDDYIVVILELWDGAVAVGDLVRLLEDESWVLEKMSARVSSRHNCSFKRIVLQWNCGVAGYV